MARQPFAQALQHGAGDLGERLPLPLERDATELEPRHLQELRHLLGHIARLFIDTARERLALFPRQPLAALGERRGGAAHHGERRAQVVGNRGEQRAPQPLGLGGGFELGLLLRAGTDALAQARNEEAHRQHDGKGEQVLGVVHGERALRRHEQNVECRDREPRGEDRRAAAVAQRDDDHR